MMIYYFLINLLSAGLLINLEEPEKPVYECFRTEGKIVVDGHIDDEAWARAPEADFVTMDGQEPRLKTRFRWLWDEDFLYGAFYVEDDHMWASMDKRDEYLWTENVVEFFIDADGCTKSYIEIEINPLNTILDLYVLNKYNARKDIKQLWDWDCDGLMHAVQLNGTLNDPSDTDQGWTFEIAIPFAQVYTAPNHPPKKGDTWMVDFCRGEGEEDPSRREVSAWAPPAFHNPLSYGTLIFRE